MNNGIWTCRVCGIDYHYYIIATSCMEYLSCEKWKISKILVSGSVYILLLTSAYVPIFDLYPLIDGFHSK